MRLNSEEKYLYYCKLPENIDERTAFILDPMLATGGSAVEAVSLVKERAVLLLNFSA